MILVLFLDFYCIKVTTLVHIKRWIYDCERKRKWSCKVRNPEPTVIHFSNILLSRAFPRFHSVFHFWLVPDRCLFVGWRGGATSLSSSVTWPLTSVWRPEVSLWTGRSLWWWHCPFPASGRSAAPPAGPSVTCGPALRGGAPWGLVVKSLSPGTPSLCHSACTQVASAAGDATVWSVLSWRQSEENLFFSLKCFQSLKMRQDHPTLDSHAALRERRQDGQLIFRVFPKPEHKMSGWHKSRKQNFLHQYSVFYVLRCVCVCVSPSGVVQVQKETFVPKFGKDLVVMSVHVACERRDRVSNSKSCHFCEKVRTYLWGSRRWTCRWCWGACCLSYKDTSASQCHRKKDSLPTFYKTEEQGCDQETSVQHLYERPVVVVRRLTLLFQWTCRSGSRGWGWRCGGRGWGWAGRQTGIPPASLGSHTPRTPSYTHTGTWRRNTCCLLSGSLEDQFPVVHHHMGDELISSASCSKTWVTKTTTTYLLWKRLTGSSPGEVKKTDLRSSL